MKISDFTQGKDNNFNLIRIISAMAVLVTHSFALAIGSGNAEPFQDTLGMTMGSIAVDVFFVTSGFLVTASLFSRQSAIEFFWARFLRIFPALIVMLLLTVFGIGILFTSLPAASYLGSSETYIYLLKCSTLIGGVAYNLPGVFGENPYKNAVNGSLWTMPNELRMYVILASVWILLRAAKSIRVKVFELAILSSTAIAAVLVVFFHFFQPSEIIFIKLFFMFFSGSSYYVLRNRINLSLTPFLLFTAAIIISASINKDAFFIAYSGTIAYVLFYLAYVPSGAIRTYNKIGDYSYGLYIYAFPVQQSIAALVPGISVFAMTISSAAATLFLAVLSWHILEKRVLGLKGRYVGHTRKILSFRFPEKPA